MASTETITLAALVALLAAGCTASAYERRATHAADAILAPRNEALMRDREATVRQPVELPPPPPAAEGESESVPAPEATAREPRVIDLRTALEIAYASNRDLLSRKEALHLSALGLSGVRHSYSPQLALALSYAFDDPALALDSNAGSATFTASQILPTGASLNVTASTDAGSLEGEAPVYGSGVSVTLLQPLLRGGGYGITHEALVLAERSLVYAIRDFELFREDFSIDVASRYYDLVNQKQSIENQKRNLESNEFGRRQAEALFAVARANELDVLRARRSELSARNQYLETQESYKLARDNFRIFLGLPPSEPIDVAGAAPEFTPVRYEVDSAIDVAFENRLDLLNRREQLEDVERETRLAENALLPDLNLTLGTAYATEPFDTLGGHDLQRSDTSLTLSLGVPLDRVRERNAYRSAKIGLARARRDLEQFEDGMRVGIQSSFRELERRLESLEINRQLIEDQTKNLRIAEIRFERGDLPNRDVVEARQSLLDAQNALIDDQVSYEISRLRLLRNLGILFVDETGMWKQ